jgi:hypothetical protein
MSKPDCWELMKAYDEGCEPTSRDIQDSADDLIAACQAAQEEIGPLMTRLDNLEEWITQL